MKNNIKEINIKKGTIEFWIKEDKVDYSGDEPVVLFELNPLGGSILIAKDSDKKIKFLHVFLGKGRTDAEYDVSKLDNGKRHMFVFTWSVKNKKIKIYIDGELKKTAKISY